MSQVRAEILDVDYPNTAAARIVINAPAAKIFEVLADPRAHASFDGSGTIEKKYFRPSSSTSGRKVWNGDED